MEIVRELREIPNLSLALGFFDGIHLGHQAVISGAVDFAHSVAGDSAAVTFKEHPYCYFNGVAPKYILSHEDKYKYFEELGLDYVIELDFAAVCQMTPMQYLEDVLVKYFKPVGISAGFNHKFGVNQTGTVKMLSDMQDRFGYVYIATPPQTIYGDMISSTVIRKFIQSGSEDMADSMLGRKFSVTGTVIKGRELGKQIGFPTANFVYPQDIIEPPYGVFDVDVILEDGSSYRGLANFGVSPTVSDTEVPLMEVYLLNFDGNLYDKDIRVCFTKMLRKEIKFNSVEELKTQIALDLQQLR